MRNMVIACPRTSTITKAKRNTVQFRDVREHRKIHMAYLLESHDWQEVFSVVDCELKCDELYLIPHRPCLMSVSHSVISVLTCSRDPPSSVRHWLNIF